jgi:hypothetical protein
MMKGLSYGLSWFRCLYGVETFDPKKSLENTVGPNYGAVFWKRKVRLVRFAEALSTHTDTKSGNMKRK